MDGTAQETIVKEAIAKETIVKVRFVSQSFTISKAGQRYRAQMRMPAGAVAIVGADAAQMLVDGLMVADVRYHFAGAPGLAAIPPGASRELMAQAGGSFVETAGPGLKIYYAQPVRLGIPRFEFGGVVGGFPPPQAITVTDTATGISESYYLWESSLAGLGPVEVTVNQPGF